MKTKYASGSQNTQRLTGIHETLSKANDPKGTRGMHVKRGSPKTLLDDEQVIACRVAHEQHGEKTHVLARRYGTSIEYMKALLDYRTRSKLFPPQPPVSAGRTEPPGRRSATS